MDTPEYLKKISTEEELIKQEANLYQEMSFSERLNCFSQIMELVEHLRPSVKYSDGEEPIERLWRFFNQNNESRETPSS